MSAKSDRKCAVKALKRAARRLYNAVILARHDGDAEHLAWYGAGLVLVKELLTAGD